MATTLPPVALEDQLARARPRLLGLAADVASNGDRSQPVPPDRVAAALDTIAELATALAAERRASAAG